MQLYCLKNSNCNETSGHSIILDLYAGYDHIELREMRVACNETRFTLACLQLSSHVTMLFSSLVKHLEGPFVKGIGWYWRYPNHS